MKRVRKLGLYLAAIVCGLYLGVKPWIKGAEVRREAAMQERKLKAAQEQYVEHQLLLSKSGAAAGQEERLPGNQVLKTGEVPLSP